MINITARHSLMNKEEENEKQVEAFETEDKATDFATDLAMEMIK